MPFGRATIENDKSLLAENDLLDPEKMPVGFNRRLGEKIAGIPSMFRLGKHHGSIERISLMPISTRIQLRTECYLLQACAHHGAKFIPYFTDADGPEPPCDGSLNEFEW